MPLGLNGALLSLAMDVTEVAPEWSPVAMVVAALVGEEEVLLG